MFDSNSDCDDSKEDLDYVPSCHDLDDGNERNNEVSLLFNPTDVSKLPVSDKNREESIWKKFLSDAKSDTEKSSEAECKTNSDCDTINNKSPADTNLVQYDKFDRVTSAISEECTSTLDRNRVSSDQRKFNSFSKTMALDKKRSNLHCVVGKIKKKSKITTLQKSLEDWNSFKKGEGIEESLLRYNKGKGGYIEKQAFLFRSDIASFEKEKNVRLAKK